LFQANEMQVLSIEADIDELQNDIEHYRDLVLDKHHEALSWETKYKLVEETLRWRKDEKAMESEIGQMKSEIHRMQIRYNHLKKAQDKLVQDLDLCILHREQIFHTANIKTALKASKQKKFQASLAQQKVENLQNKIKSLKHEIKRVEEGELADLINERDTLFKAVATMQNQLKQEAEDMKGICSRIEEEKLRKYFNLEQIVRKQQRSKYYRHLITSRVPPKITRSEISIEADIQKQMEINENMTELLQTLADEFPEISHWFNKIAQILRD